MARNKKNLIARIQSWMDSVPGQMFMNYAYSWGAAIVILGTLFKLTYLPGANAMLFIGMGTEVFVFIISGFDRPAGLKESEEESEEAVGENDYDDLSDEYDDLSDEKEEQTVVSEQLQKDSEGQTVQQPVQPSVHRGAQGGHAGPGHPGHRRGGLQHGEHQEPPQARRAL